MCSCSPARKDHNTAALQLDSQQTTPAVISADGKCEFVPESTRLGAMHDSLEVIEIMIDGHRMVGGIDSPTLIGQPGEFLPESRHFTLTHFEPQQDGRCLARYVRRRTKDSPHHDRSFTSG